MSFNKNPPWARNANSNQPSMGIYAAYPNQGIGMQQQQQQQQQNLSIMNQMQGNPMFQAVSYPTPRSLNTLAFAQNNSSQQLQQAQPANQTQSKFNPNQRGFSGTGVVTKIQNDYGYIDDEIFFHKNVCVKGVFPQKGERVLVEATYNANMQTKWNATRVQVLPNSGGGGGGGGASTNVSRTNSIPSLMGNTVGKGYNAVPPPDRERERESRFDDIRGRDPRKRDLSPVRRSPESHRSRDTTRARDTESQESDRKRRREDRDKDRHRHSPDRRDRRAPERRRKPIARYMVQIPKISLAMTAADVLELKRRYTNLYVPSDFFNTQIRWVDAFPPHTPFSIQKPCAFHIMAKDVESPFENDAFLDPPDADYLFSAKVMLMGTPPLAEMYQKCFANAEDKEDDDRDFIHPARLINFLVGTRGKNESMAIGGPWSPSLDGDNPKSNPNVLIKTAIRNCKALTGIDLSDCTRWYRFVELYYRRTESHKGRLTPARVETVVIFLPDIRSCQPTRIEWDNINSMYKSKLESVIKNYNNQKVDDAGNADAVAVAGATAVVAATTQKSTSSPTKNADQTGDGGAAETIADSTAAIDGAKVDEADTKLKDSDTSLDESQMHDVAAGNEKADDESDGVAKGDPTHYSALDPKTMKVSDLRVELEARGLSSKGLKAQLLARLLKALKTEETDEAEKNKPATENGDTEEVTQDDGKSPMETDEDKKTDVMVIEEEMENVEESVDFDISEVTVIDEYKADEKAPKKEEIRKLDERERTALEKKYTLPSTPHIVVHPHRTAKSGKFDCTVMSLSLLLDYRPEDTKEHSFEVSLFAELFNEMLMRDFGFNIYKALSLLPERTKEEKKDDKKDDKKSKPEESKEKEKSEDTADGKVEEKEKTSEAAAAVEAEPIENSDDKKSDKEKEDKSNKRSRPDDSADDDTSRSGSDRKKKDSKDKEKEKEKDKDKVSQKLVTVDPELLLSFVYFDQTQCGYIFEKDVEDLFYTLGLCLSRAQTRKLAAKAITRDSLHYRKLTDKPKDDDTAIVEPSVPGDEDLTLLELAKGNNAFLPTAVVLSPEKSSGVAVPPAKRSRKSECIDDTPVVSTSGMVMFNGALVDLKKLMEQMQRSDRARDDTEQILVDLRKQNSELATSNSKANSKIKDLQVDVKSLSRKLGDTEQNLNTANRKGSEYFSVLASIHDRVAPLFVKAEKSSRSDTSRDKDRERDRIDSPKIRDAKDKDKDTKDKGKDNKDSKDKSKEKEKSVTKDTETAVDVKAEVKKDSETEVKEEK